MTHGNAIPIPAHLRRPSGPSLTPSPTALPTSRRVIHTPPHTRCSQLAGIWSPPPPWPPLHRRPRRYSTGPEGLRGSAVADSACAAPLWRAARPRHRPPPARGCPRTASWWAAGSVASAPRRRWPRGTASGRCLSRRPAPDPAATSPPSSAPRKGTSGRRVPTASSHPTPFSPWPYAHLAGAPASSDQTLAVA